MNDEMELEVFRAGDYGEKGKWTERELDAIAESYSASNHEAPVTLDHAQSGPALGWVAGVRRAGDRLLARLRKVHPDLARALREGTFRKRSVELYHNLAGSGGPYLKAVSFLGAAAPAVKGLTDPVFTAVEPEVRFAAENGGYTSFGSELTPDEQDPGRGSGNRTPDVRSFAETKDNLKRSGKWNPRWDAMGVPEFHAAVVGIDGVGLGGSDRKSLSVWFEEFLASLDPHIPVGEAAPGSAAGTESGIPAGGNISPVSLRMHRKVCAMREADPKLSYTEALLRCSGA